jgi:hypothetical protein
MRSEALMEGRDGRGVLGSVRMEPLSAHPPRLFGNLRQQDVDMAGSEVLARFDRVSVRREMEGWGRIRTVVVAQHDRIGRFSCADPRPAAAHEG